jgi:hypothetical protein
MRFYCITSLSQYTHYKNKDNKTALLEQLNKDFMAYLRGKEYGNSKVLDRHTNKSEKDRLLEFKVLFGPDWNINMRFEFNDTPLLIAISNRINQSRCGSWYVE